MVSRGPNPSQARPEVGDTLIVIHDFQARSSDELSMAKGDRVELLERDDEFGDSWFLGRHLANGNTGLFPEVYTRPVPKTAPPLAPSKLLAPAAETRRETRLAAAVDAAFKSARPPITSASPARGKSLEAPVTLPLKSSKLEMLSKNGASRSPSSVPIRPRIPTEDSQVLNETLNVINEHITDMHSSSPGSGPMRTLATDSGSEYSAPQDPRLSYIQGEETDEEEDQDHTRAQVAPWTPDDVSEYLLRVGVERQHCDVFRDQEISGEVLLGMDQNSLFIKAFDLGSVGRRLKTWHKIKALQDEVTRQDRAALKSTTQTSSSEIGSEDAGRARSRTSTVTLAASHRPASLQTPWNSSLPTPKPSTAAPHNPASPHAGQDGPMRSAHSNRPSAASIRELNHSRRHSSTDFRNSGHVAAAAVPALNPFPDAAAAAAAAAHRKQPSFDRNWTLGSAFSQRSPRPLSSANLQDVAKISDPEPQQDSAVDLDKGYFSGTEADGRKRNVLRKRESVAEARTSSYAEEQRVRSATALSRHSRFSSAESYRDTGLSPAVQKYYGLQLAARGRTASTATVESFRPLPPPKDEPSPAVTRLDSGLGSDQAPASPTASKHAAFAPDWLSAVVSKPSSKGRPGIRAISDKLMSGRARDNGLGEMVTKEPSLTSSNQTESSTPSGGLGLEADSLDLAKGAQALAGKNKKKSKKMTSAYTRGLQRISPLEAQKSADYYGWMKKKSSNLMTTWKPRLFVLRGRRLAYYYSEEDEEEKGLIDISFHRVLPADNEKLTGLHATITGAVGGPGMPVTSFMTGNGGSELGQGADRQEDSVFIFKLVPPRTGLPKAVNFTKPTVHYFAVPNLQQGRLWMAALMKATIDRDDRQPITSTYQQKTISLTKAQQMCHRPPALMNLDEATEGDELRLEDGGKHGNGSAVFGESDSGVSGMDKYGGGKLGVDFAAIGRDVLPQNA